MADHHGPPCNYERQLRGGPFQQHLAFGLRGGVLGEMPDGAAGTRLADQPLRVCAANVDSANVKEAAPKPSEPAASEMGARVGRPQDG